MKSSTPIFISWFLPKDKHHFQLVWKKGLLLIPIISTLLFPGGTAKAALALCKAGFLKKRVPSLLWRDP